MEAVILFVLGILFGFLVGIVLTGVPYLYRKNKKKKQHGFRYRCMKDHDDKDDRLNN